MPQGMTEEVKMEQFAKAKVFFTPLPPQAVPLPQRGRPIGLVGGGCPVALQIRGTHFFRHGPSHPGFPRGGNWLNKRVG